MADSSAPRYRQAVEAFFPIVSAALLVAITAVLYSIAVRPLFPHGLGLCLSPVPHPSRPFVELHAVLWWVSMTLFIGASAVEFGVFVRALADLWWRRWRARTRVAFAAAVAALVLLGLGTMLPARNLTVLDALVSDLFQRAPVFRVFSFANALALLTSFCFVAAASACVLPDPGAGALADARTNAARESRARWLKLQAGALQSILFAGAAGLVAGVIEVEALFGWAAAHVDGPKADATAKLVTQVASGVYGTWFSMLLAAVYFPAAVVLRGRMRALAAEALPGSAGAARERWLSTRGLDLPLKTQVSTLLAILGPVLTAGPLGTLGHAFG